MNLPDQITALIEAGQLEEAAEALLPQLSAQPGHPEWLRLGQALVQPLHHRCMDLACNRATESSREAQSLDALMRELKRLLREGGGG